MSAARSSMARTATGVICARPAKPWTMPAYWRDTTGTPAARSLRRERHAFVAQRIVFGRGDRRRRHAGQVGLQRRRERVAGVRRIRQVQAPAPLHGGTGQQEAPGELVHRRGVARRIDHRIQHSHVADAGPAGARELRARECQVRTGAVAADREPRGVDTEAGGLSRDPDQRRVAIVDRAWKTRLRCAPVVHRDDDAIRAACQLMTDRIVRVEIAEHVAAAMAEQRHRQVSPRIRPIDAYRQRAGRPGDCDILDRVQRDLRRGRQVRLVAGAHVLDRDVRRRRAKFAALVGEQRVETGIHGHGHAPAATAARAV